MTTESIFTTLLAAAASLKKPVQEIASQSLKDAYETAKVYLLKKLSENSTAGDALEMATEKPESDARKAMLLEETESAGLETDAELQRLIEQVATLLPESAETVLQNIRVGGHGNKVQVAGRDIISTERHIQRNAITPDKRHITAEQRGKIRGVIAELAARFVHDDGRPNFAAGHRMLQHRFEIASYVLLTPDKFDAALGFLKQQRAIGRSRLRHRNPAAYRSDLFRAIFSRAGELRWGRQKVYAFAIEKLGLKKPLSSLKQLGPNHLKSLAELLRRETAR